VEEDEEGRVSEQSFIEGDCRVAMAKLDAESVDAIVC